MSYKPVATYAPLATNADNAVVWQLLGNAEGFDTVQLGSVTGVMDVYGSGDGINFLASPIGLTDLTTGVIAAQTTAGKHFGFRGRYKAIMVLQQGVTAITLGYVLLTEAA